LAGHRHRGAAPAAFAGAGVARAVFDVRDELFELAFALVALAHLHEQVRVFDLHLAVAVLSEEVFVKIPRVFVIAAPRLAARQLEELSYSTVVTIVSRLHAKGLLERERTGRAFAYRPVDDASLAASQMSQALQAGTDHGAVLSRFVSGLSGRDARMLRHLLVEDEDQPG